MCVKIALQLVVSCSYCISPKKLTLELLFLFKESLMNSIKLHYKKIHTDKICYNLSFQQKFN